MLVNTFSINEHDSDFYPDRLNVTRFVTSGRIHAAEAIVRLIAENSLAIDRWRYLTAQV